MTEQERVMEAEEKKERIFGYVCFFILVFFSYLTIWGWFMPSPTEAFNSAYSTCLWGPKGKEGKVRRTYPISGLERNSLEITCSTVATRAQRNASPPPFNWLIR
tara:strand:+ start:704 stop:1015 length:312 start_codon:yes stop_codon:yes gene_type:complete